MDKLKAHYSIIQIKQLIKSGNYSVTATARKTAFNNFGLLEEELINIVLDLAMTDFYKSMTSYNDSKLWHNVYRKKIKEKVAYIKLQVFENNSIVISFKEK